MNGMIKFQFKRMTSNEECESFQRKRLKTEVQLSFDLDFFVQIIGLIFSCYSSFLVIA